MERAVVNEWVSASSLCRTYRKFENNVSKNVKKRNQIEEAILVPHGYG